MLVSDGGGGLFLSPIPVPPGDPAALSSGAATYTAAQGEIERDRAGLTSAASQAGGTAWTGTGAAGYMAAASELAAGYSLASAALARGATALRSYASDLATAQQTAKAANAAVTTSNAAASAMLAAQSAASQAQAAADDAAQTATSAEAQATASPHSPAAKLAADNARSAATDAQSSAASAQDSLSAAAGQYDADYSRAVSLCAQAQEQATTAASRAASGFDSAMSELMGKSPRPVHGGARGIAGGGAWSDLIADVFRFNNAALTGAVLNSWGAFGAVVLSRAGIGALEAAADTGRAFSSWGSAVDAITGNKGGFYSTQYYQKWDNFLAAADEEKTAFGKFLTAIRPNPGDYGFGANFARAGLGVAMAGDVLTEWRPGASFGPGGMFGGNAARVAAGVNFAASGLALGSSLGYAWAGATIALIPGGQVVVAGVLIGTAAYFAGEFVYQHWNDVTSWGKDAWHSLEGVQSWADNEVSHFGHDIGKALSWL
jgi:hypothetical protein